MKKIYSFVAALVVAMVVLVSCGSSSAYQAQLDAAKAAVEAKDCATVFAKVDEIMAGDKMTADDAVISLMYAMNAYGIKTQGGQIDPQENLDLCKKIAGYYQKAKSFKAEDVETINSALKAVSGSDIMATAAQYEASIPTIEAQIQAAQQQAEAAAESAEEAVEEAPEE
ncbi:MAG: hypothetical protein K6F33_00700 [Bacteroidales bacterium]|nr:hypothetical protein [Bacteroidales bacterium]